MSENQSTIQPEVIQAERLGAQARAAGRAKFANPFLDTYSLPDRTGEDPAAWMRRVEAWDRGWAKEVSRER